MLTIYYFSLGNYKFNSLHFEPSLCPDFIGGGKSNGLCPTVFNTARLRSFPEIDPPKSPLKRGTLRGFSPPS